MRGREGEMRGSCEEERIAKERGRRRGEEEIEGERQGRIGVENRGEESREERR